jgi:AraC-like DNA-binding protein
MDLLSLADSKLPLLRSQQAAEVGQHLSQFLVSTRVTSVNAFSRPARVSGVRIGAFSIALVELGAPASIEAVTRGDYALMTLCLHGSGQMEVDGRVIPVPANHGLLGLPHGVVRATFSGDCVRLIVRIDARVIDRRSLFSTARFELSNPAIEPFLEQVHSILSSRAMIAAINNEPSVRERVEALLATLLQRTCLPAIADHGDLPIASRDVRRAEAFIRSNVSRNIRLQDIARAAGVSTRTLQTSFKRDRHVTPMQYLRNLRLDAVRQRLLAGSSVAEAALDTGFAHQGRFAHYYRSRFGHSPSSTGGRGLPSSVDAQAAGAEHVHL